MSISPDPITKTVQVPMNIAFVKYWGKADHREMLPLNDSISVNLNDLFAETKVTLRFNEVIPDSVVVNGKSLSCDEGTRFFKVFTEFRRIIGPLFEYFFSIEVVSTTSFPVKAGLASSAAGFAALAYALGKAVNLKDPEIARLARLGSGSACRSLFPGFVHWDSSKTKPNDEFVFPLPMDQKFVSSLLAFVFLFNKEEKMVGSSDGMARTVQTSELYMHRIAEVVPEHVKKMKCAIAAGEFGVFAEVTMKESNSLHAVCLDTFPPLIYLNESSFQLINAIHEINKPSDDPIAAYTFDAGPNAVVFVQEQNACFFAENLQSFFSTKFCFTSHESSFQSFDERLQNVLMKSDLASLDKSEIEVLVTRIGNGPRLL